MGEGVLADIARELVAIMRRDIRTDWTVREDVRAKLRTSIKRLLIKHGYPPDEQPAAIKLVLEQMEAMAPRFAQTRADLCVLMPETAMLELGWPLSEKAQGDRYLRQFFRV